MFVCVCVLCVWVPCVAALPSGGGCPLWGCGALPSVWVPFPCGVGPLCGSLVPPRCVMWHLLA